MSSDHNGIKVEINSRKIAGKSQIIFRLNNTFLNNTQVDKKSWEKLKWTKWKCNKV